VRTSLVASDFGFKIAESFVTGGRSLVAPTISPAHFDPVQAPCEWLDPKSDAIDLSSALDPTSLILWFWH
jgi:hypothetical protein